MTNEALLEAVFWIAATFLVGEISGDRCPVGPDEVVEQTWSTLLLTPRWLVTVLGQKLLGAAIGILPGLLVCVAFGMSSLEVRRFWSELFFDIRPGRDDSQILMTLPVTCAAVRRLVAADGLTTAHSLDLHRDPVDGRAILRAGNRDRFVAAVPDQSAVAGSHFCLWDGSDLRDIRLDLHCANSPTDRAGLVRHREED